MIAKQQPIALLAFAALAALVLAICVVITRSELFLLHPAMTGAVTFDLTITLPGLYYFLLVRPGRVAAISLLPVFLACVRVAHLILPAGHHAFLQPLLFIAAPLELVAICLLIQRVRRISKHLFIADSADTDAMERLQTAARAVYGDNRIVDFLMTEWSVFYFGLIGWRSQAVVPEGTTAISCYRKSGWGALVAVLAFCVLLEGSIAHLLLQRWSVPAAWIWTGLDLYAILWILADYQALRLRPHLLSDRDLRIRFGLRWSGIVPLHQIAAIKPFRTNSRPPVGKDYLKLALLSQPDFVLILREPIEFRGLAGIRRSVTRVGLATDDAELFSRLQEAIEK